jgi:8-oxo-dGTP diphosphatase
MKREYPDQPIVAVGAAVCRDEQVLVVQRGRAPSRGVWTVPGGAVDLGERMAEAAAREVREECGIEIEVGEPVGILDAVVRDEGGRIRFHYAIVDFAARYVSGVLRLNDELLDAAWITPLQFDAYRVPAKAREILDKALRFFGSRMDLPG